METILVTPRNQQELLSVQEFLQKTRVKSTVLSDEDLDDLKLFDKALTKIKRGKAEFFSLADVKKKFEIS